MRDSGGGRRDGPLPNTRGRELLEWFESVPPDVCSALERGEALIEGI
jgi:hypothetical protein